MPLYKKSKAQDGLQGAPLTPEGALFQLMSDGRRSAVTGALDEKAMYPDRLLLQTHPSEMSSRMLDAAQVRINEDPEFAEAYRNSTDYVPNPLKAMKRLGERALSSTGAGSFLF